MDRQTVLLVALALLVIAAAVVAVVGWMLLARDRRAASVTDGADSRGTEAS